MPIIPIVPRLEPEVVQKLKQKHFPKGDPDDKVGNVVTKFVTHGRTKLVSRYSHAREYDVMIAMLHALDPKLQNLVKEMFCDSKANWCYSVELYKWDRIIAWLIGHHMEDATKHANGGHNGIMVYCGDDRVDVDPNWFELFEDYED